MKAKGKSRRVSQRDWLAAGLAALATEGPGGLRIERLARRLSVSRSGYYWHFQNREHFVKALLAYWLDEFAQVVTRNKELLQAKPRRRLELTAEMIDRYDLAGYDLAFRMWALTEPLAARAVRQVNRARLDFLRQIFGELGFEGDDLEMRAVLFVCYHTWERTMFRELSAQRRRELCEHRLRLLLARAR